MGKIRTKLIGSEEVEKKQAEKAEARREAKKIKTGETPAKNKPTDKSEKKAVEKPAKEERGMATIGVTDEQLEKMQAAEQAGNQETNQEAEQTEAEEKKASSRPKRKKHVGKKYKAAQKAIDKGKGYKIADAVAILKKISYTRFDSSVELHINSKTVGLKGEVQLPHLTGKTVKVAILDEATLKNIEKGAIDFDVLIARPADMPKLVPLAKILGPKGLMPSPKRGTLSDKPEEAAKKFASGGLQWKTEAKFPLIHLTVGKISNKDNELSENIDMVLKSVDPKNIDAVFLSSSMSPSIRLKVS